MFIIRKEQIDAFRDHLWSDFENRAILHLREFVTEATAGITDDELRHRVRACALRAKMYGLTTERQIMDFVDASFFLSERFDEEPEHSWSVEVLLAEKLSADVRSGFLAQNARVFFEEKRARRQ
jgi:hypothetical protein